MEMTNFLIGGEEVSDFITEADKLIYGQEVDVMVTDGILGAVQMIIDRFKTSDEINDLESRIDELECDNAELEYDNDDLQYEINYLENKIDELEAEIEEYKNQINALQEENDELREANM